MAQIGSRRAMAIDYVAQSEAHRPAVIETLLVGEAPPPSGNSYFYLPTTLCSTKSIRDNRSLPATIFYHYFQRLPSDEGQYSELLLELKRRGVFLVDILDEPVKVRDSPEGVQQIVGAIPKLREKLRRRNIDVPEDCITFLLARKTYQKSLKAEFPRSRLVPWIEFRMQRAEP